MKQVHYIYIFLFINSFFVFAQDAATSDVSKSQNDFLNSDQNWSVEIPIWIPGFRGQYAYGDIELKGEDGTYQGCFS